MGAHAANAYALAWAHRRNGKHKDAVAAFDTLIAASPKDWGAYLWRAESLSQCGQYQPALKSLEKAAELHPRGKVFPFFRGRIQFDHGHYKQAIASFAEAARLQPDTGVAQAYHDLALLASGQVSEGIDALARRRLPGDSGFQGRLLMVVEGLLAGRPGVRTLEECIVAREQGARRKQLAGDTVPGWRAVLYRALVTVQHPIGHKARQAAYHVSLGDYLLRADRLDAGLAECRAALELEPDRLELRSLVIDILLALHRDGEAAEALAVLKKTDPEFPDIDARFGLVRYRQGSLAPALDHLRRAAAQAPREFLWPYYCGLCELGLGHPDQARRWFEQATGMVHPRIAWERLMELARVV